MARYFFIFPGLAGGGPRRGGRRLRPGQKLTHRNQSAVGVQTTVYERCAPHTAEKNYTHPQNKRGSGILYPRHYTKYKFCSIPGHATCGRELGNNFDIFCLMPEVHKLHRGAGGVRSTPWPRPCRACRRWRRRAGGPAEPAEVAEAGRRPCRKQATLI